VPRSVGDEGTSEGRDLREQLTKGTKCGVSGPQRGVSRGLEQGNWRGTVMVHAKEKGGEHCSVGNLTRKEGGGGGGGGGGAVCALHTDC